MRVRLFRALVGRAIVVCVSAVYVFAVSPLLGFGQELADDPLARRCLLTDAQLSAAIEALDGFPLATASREAIRRVLEGEGPYVPSGMSVEEMETEARCAKTVEAIFREIFGPESGETARGVSGHAWNIPANVLAFGGSTAPALSGLIATLRPGDLIGLRYRFTAYPEKEAIAGFTHIAVVLSVLPGGDPVIAHAWRVPVLLRGTGPAGPVLRIESLASLLDAFVDGFKPALLIRPKL